MALLYNDSTQYGVGAFFTGFMAFFSGLGVPETLTAALVLPLLVMIFINIPKFLREALLLYREYQEPRSTAKRLKEGLDADKDATLF